MNLRPPKFEIGDFVKLTVTGQVEGLDVSATRRVCVYGLLQSLSGGATKYSLYDPEKPHLTWERFESQLQEVEPVVNEIKKVRAAT